MAVNWRVDEGLSVLIAQWKKEHPGAVVYTIGDASHASRDSEHNPEPSGSAPGADYGEVDAADFMKGHGVTSADLQELRDALVKNRDSRLWYVIWNKKITSSTTQPWKERVYLGKDDHTDHAHVSVNDKFDKNIKPWDLEDELKTHVAIDLDGLKTSEVKFGDDDSEFSGFNAVRRVQGVLWALVDHGIEVDGIYGAQTRNALKTFMSRSGDAKNTGMKVGLPEAKALFGMWSA
jgi:peptidoglycan hydrolase-like protein with peptidoglycan-binding domain